MGTHRGTGANDVRGAYAGVKYPYYAPCDCKLIWRDLANGQAIIRESKICKWKY